MEFYCSSVVGSSWNVESRNHYHPARQGNAALLGWDVREEEVRDLCCPRLADSAPQSLPLSSLVSVSKHLTLGFKTHVT